MSFYLFLYFFLYFSKHNQQQIISFVKRKRKRNCIEEHNTADSIRYLRLARKLLFFVFDLR